MRRKLPTWVFAVGLIVVICAGIIYFDRKNSMRTWDGFTDGGGDTGELLIVKAGWCGHCKNAMPEFKRLVDSSPIKLQNGNTVTVRMLDEGTDKAEINTLGVKGFPSIIYKTANGQQKEYSGERTYTGVISFLNTN